LSVNAATARTDPLDDAARYPQLHDPLDAIVLLVASVVHVVPLLELTTILLFGIAAYIFEPSGVIATPYEFPHPVWLVVVHATPPFVLTRRFVT
jgi:hypothetical protein